MIEQTRKPTSDRANRRSGHGAGWKSGLLASGLGAVLLGWALLAHGETAGNVQTVAQVQAAPSAQVLTVQTPANNQLGSQSGTGLRANSVPAMPKAPAFQRPLTRTRGS